MSIAENIKICRIQNNLTQKQLGEKMFVSDKTISKWESNRSIPDVDTIKKLAEVLNIEYDVLIDGNEARSNKKSLNKQILGFVSEQKREIIYGSVLFVLFVTTNLVPDNIAWFILYGSIFWFSISQMVVKSKWYVLGLLISLMQFFDMMNTYLHLEIDLIFLSVFVYIIAISLVIIIVKLVKQMRMKDYKMIPTIIGNVIIFLNIVFISGSFNVGYHSSINYAEGYIESNTNLFILSLMFYLLLYLHKNIIEPKIKS